jgi:hypothetical protein
MQYFGFVDLLITPLALFIIYAFARQIKNKNIAEHPEYKYFIPGLTVKLLGAVSLCIIYGLYYGGGDTINYYYDSVVMVKLLAKNPAGFYEVIIHGSSDRNYLYFDGDTGWPHYFRDKPTFMVVRIVCTIVLFAFKSIIASNIYVATLSFWGVWKLYKVFISEFPTLSKEMAIAVLFIPSVFFWGSGILKDTITFTMTGFYLHSFYYTFVKRKLAIGKIFLLVISIYIILLIKPYIILALIASSAVWLAMMYIGKIKGGMARTAVTPVLVIISAFLGYTFLNSLGSQLGVYAVDKVLERAVVTQRDLKSDYYRGNSFDIGEFDATFSSMLGKAPIAIASTLFRPTLLEAQNPVMFISALENAILLFFTIRIIIRTKIAGFLLFFTKHHLLTFSIVFSLFFAFSVGISTSNFGSLVRYRIPILPFYVASLYIINYYFNLAGNRKEDKLKEELDQMTTRRTFVT